MNGGDLKPKPSAINSQKTEIGREIEGNRERTTRRKTETAEKGANREERKTSLVINLWKITYPPLFNGHLVFYKGR